MEKSGSNSLSIASVWEPNEGCYHQVINGPKLWNQPVLELEAKGSYHFLLIKCHELCLLSVPHIAEPSRITSHPHGEKDSVPGKHGIFTIQDTKPLCYWRATEEKVGSDDYVVVAV